MENQKTAFSSCKSTHRRSAFTLVEILMSMIILTVIMGSILGLFLIIIKNMEQSNDVTHAQQHGEMVLTLLENKIKTAGLGTTASRDLFDDVFNGISFASWKEAIHVTNNSKDVAIIYALPSGILVSGEATLVTNNSVSLDLIGTLPSGIINTNIAETTGWVTFPATEFPVRVSATSPKLSVLPKKDGKVFSFDELHFIRLSKARVENDWFIIEDVANPNTVAQNKAVQGISDILFDKSAEDGTFSVYVLCRGAQRYDNLVSNKSISVFTNIPDEARHYRLRVVEGKWRVRNQ